MTTLTNSMKGPVAYGVSIIAMVGAGGTLAWGGEINEFSRRAIFLVLVISFLAFATSIYSTLFASGAVIP